MINLNYLMDHYSISDLQDCFECIIKKHETVTVKNPPIRIYKSKIFKITIGYYLEILTPETIKLL